MWCLNFERTLCARNTLRLCEMPSEASNAFQHEKRSHNTYTKHKTHLHIYKTQPRGSWRGRRTNPKPQNIYFCANTQKFSPNLPKPLHIPKKLNTKRTYAKHKTHTHKFVKIYATQPPTRYRVRFLSVSCSFARDFGPQNLRSRTDLPGTKTYK